MATAEPIPTAAATPSDWHARSAAEVLRHLDATPAGLDATSIDPAVVERERAVLTEKAQASGKPANVIEKIVESGLKTFFKEVTLVDQPFVHDSSKKGQRAPAGRSFGARSHIGCRVRVAATTSPNSCSRM